MRIIVVSRYHGAVIHQATAMSGAESHRRGMVIYPFWA
jgi:hypothetical protein